MGIFSAQKISYYYRAASISKIGRRPTQQDACGLLFPSDKQGLFFAAVADGMGGMQNGKEAAEQTVQRMLNGYEKLKLKSNIDNISDKISMLAISTNDDVFNTFEGNAGTTLASIAIVADKLYWVAVGDSMLFLCRDGRMFRLNHEHSYHMYLRRDALLSGNLEDLPTLNTTDEHRLSAYIGSPDLFDIDRNLHPYTLLPGDKIVLCTDGVSRTINNSTMSVILKNPPDRVVDIIEGLVEHKANPRQDNYTAVVVEVLVDDQV